MSDDDKPATALDYVFLAIAILMALMMARAIWQFYTDPAALFGR